MAGAWFDGLARSAVAIAVTDARLAAFPVIFVNAAFETLTGFAAADVLGTSLWDLQVAGEAPAAADRLEAAVATTGIGSADLLCRRRDGQIFWNRLNVTTIPDLDGVPAYRLAMQADVSGDHQLGPMLQEVQAQRLKLAEAHERLKVMQSVTSAAGAWEWDILGHRLTGDARFASLNGLDLAEAAAGLPGAAFFQAIHEEDRMRMRIAVAAALQGAEVFARDYRVVVDGEVRWVAARGRTFLDAEERPVRFAGVLADISEQKKAEERLTIAQTAGGVGSFEYLNGYGTADVSAEFCRLLGLRPAQSLPVRTINAVVHHDDPDIIQNRDGHLAPGPVFHECRISRADTGEERWLATRGEYRRRIGGGILFAGVIYDITTTKRSEAALRQLTETLEERVAARTQERDRVWNLSRDLLNVIGPDGLQKAVNPAWTQLLGHAEAELVGTSMERLVHPEELSAFRLHMAARRQGEATSDADIRLRGHDGSWRWVSWTAVLEDGMAYGIGRDVTQRKLLEEQLRQSQKMEAVGQLTGGLAHDFNNMLTGILGGMEMVRRRIRQGRLNEVDRFLDAALQSGHRAAALTHRLLAFSRRQTLDSRPLDIGALVASIEDLLRRALGERIELVVDIAVGLWAAVADGNQLESALLNLAINARDAMPQGGRLTILARNAHLSATDLAQADRVEAGDFVEIRVTDTGAGMSPEIRARAFEPFFTTKPMGEGTGLGLSMIYGFVQQSRGNITIDSQEGRGTSVRLFLPRHVGALPVAVERASDAAMRGSGETVLVVEDDPAVRLLVLQVLEELGYRAIETADGSEAVAILQSGRRIDLLVSDVGLPGLNGRQIADIARRSRPGLPVLFMTAYAKEAKEQATFLATGMEMIRKPFSIDEIGNRINAILNKSRHGVAEAP